MVSCIKLAIARWVARWAGYDLEEMVRAQKLSESYFERQADNYYRRIVDLSDELSNTKTARDFAYVLLFLVVGVLCLVVFL